MALSKSGKAASNVSKLDDARKRRSTSGSSPQPVEATGDVVDPDLNPEQADAVADTVADAVADAAADSDTVGNVEKPGPKAKTTSKPKVSNRRFDRVKVDRLKSEIASGKYEIDYLNVADKFIEHERYA